MKIKVCNLLQGIDKKREEIKKEVMPSNEKEVKLINSLFDDISTATEIEEYISDIARMHSKLDFGVDYISENLDDSDIKYAINDVIKNREMNKVSDLNDIKEIFKEAGYELCLSVATNVRQELLQVYLLNELYSYVENLDNEKLLDCSEYADFEDEDSAIEEFLTELIYKVYDNANIINIDDEHKNLFEEFFSN